MRLGYTQEPATLDPVGDGGGSAATRDILRPVLPALFALGDDLEPRPELASSWPRRSDFAFDPFSVAVTLRDARWSDGRPITSSDVRFSWTKLRDGPTGYRYRHLRAVDTPTDRSVRLRFDRPIRRWWALFSIDDMVLPAHAHSPEWSRRPTVSGGPFVVREWTPGLRVRLVRNERYWGRKSRLGGIDVLFVPDDETRLQLLERDDLDVVFSEGEINVGRRAGARGFDTVNGPLSGQGGASAAWGPTWWELDLAPGRLRPPVAGAVVHAAHPGLIAEILEDSGQPLNGIPPTFTEASWETIRPWQSRGSLGQAKGLLDLGRIPPGERRAEFQLAFARGSAASAIARFIHFRMREVGVTVELVGLEPESFDSEWVPNRRAPAFLRLRRGADAPDAASYAAASGQPGAAEVDEVVTSAESDVDRDRLTAEPVVGLARRHWDDVQRRLARVASVAPLARTRTWLIARSGVWGPHALGAANGPLWNAGAWQAGRGD